MDLDWPKIIPMSISSVAACISVLFSIKSRQMQTKLIENKSDIETLSELIETLKTAKAVREHCHDFKDDDFTSADNLSEVPAKIAKLIQSQNLASQIDKSEWNLPITDLERKINSLHELRKLLF